MVELFEKLLVIRTDNEDSFQGPVPQLKNFRSARAGILNFGASPLATGGDYVLSFRTP